jgi:hypothetical protein
MDTMSVVYQENTFLETELEITASIQYPEITGENIGI